MRKEIAVLLVSVSLLLVHGNVQALNENQQADLFVLVNKLDTSIASLRQGDVDDASTLISEASDMYQADFSPEVENIDNSLDSRIEEAFTSLKQEPTENGIFALKNDVIQAAGLTGIFLSPVYSYSMFIILVIALAASLFVTLLNKRLVNWDFVKESRAKISEFQKELREARSKRDMKQLHRIQQRQAEILKLQGEMFKQTLKPTIVYLVPLMILWMVLLNVYAGWVVAWLPFSIDLPIFGRLVAFGVGWWYFISYMGFSQIFRKILIGD
ncbi:MAG TPA: DUF106 domain-containing protein [Hadesarchaea archaeon]|nr:DUF106 domain-containing protein [Hadesarchaea archaeon]